MLARMVLKRGWCCTLMKRKTKHLRSVMFCINLGNIVVSHSVLLLRFLLKVVENYFFSIHHYCSLSFAGRTKTLHRLASKYYWTNMVEDIVAMVMIKFMFFFFIYFFIIANKIMLMRFTVALARFFSMYDITKKFLF